MPDSKIHVLDRSVLESHAEPDASLILLHGLGADGFDLQPLIAALDLPPALRLRFVFPHAPQRPITVNGGHTMRGWYDIRHADLRLREDEAGIRESVAGVTHLIHQEQARGIAPERLILAGFSQGGVIALHAGLRYPERLGGIVALSTYLPCAASLDTEANAANADTPVFLAHGLHDPIVPHALALEARRILSARGHPVLWHSYPMGHGIIADEIRDLRPFLADIFTACGHGDDRDDHVGKQLY